MKSSNTRENAVPILRYRREDIGCLIANAIEKRGGSVKMSSVGIFNVFVWNGQLHGLITPKR